MINFRKFKKKDLEQLHNIYLLGFSNLYGENAEQYANQFLKLYQSALLKGIEGELFVAEKKGKIIGFAVIHKETPKDYKFGPIVVVPSAQHQGTGSQLLQMCINFARSKRAKQFYLKVHENNLAAINLYKKFGFSITETFPSDLDGIDFVKMVYIL